MPPPSPPTLLLMPLLLCLSSLFYARLLSFHFSVSLSLYSFLSHSFSCYLYNTLLTVSFVRCFALFFPIFLFFLKQVASTLPLLLLLLQPLTLTISIALFSPLLSFSLPSLPPSLSIIIGSPTSTSRLSYPSTFVFLFILLSSPPPITSLCHHVSTTPYYASPIFSLWSSYIY